MRLLNHKKVGTTDFLLIDFYKLGTHEKFYDDLKADPRNFLQQFLEFIQPGAHITHLIKDSVYKGVEKKIDGDIKLKLLQKNIPQYQFLAQKFGPGSYPAQWLENALKQV